ncbi:hypothetical protein M3I54_04345 [Paraburkholderia sp. CNPSo 3274]|uniref:hypothetical protein n=1 Tax=Paraburkholderia sp. CNPSo 3274 TaxID=2940932 RepID=UPI0020B727B3|nr:hypothetical protein [Paraburkholderia sp. CNPSo 3274]MCP3706220.1 hypothetical protein [Paraburkholderia sp. CNPSo 3274]
MNEPELGRVAVEDNFAVAQVALYLFAILQVVLTLMTATGAVPLGIAAQASTMQRLSATSNTAVNLLCFAVGYVLLARCLNRCTPLVWRIALGIFLLNTGVACTSDCRSAQPLSSLDLWPFCRRRDIDMERARSDQKV